MANRVKPLTRQEIANLFIDPNNRITEIQWTYRQLADAEKAKREEELKKLGFRPSMVIR